MLERSFVMLKPGVLNRRVAGEIISRFEKKGLKLIALKMLQIGQPLARRHYAEHEGKGFFEELMAYTTSAPVIAMVLEGDGAIAIIRKLCGATRVEEASPGTIRGDYAMHTTINVIHASDSVENAEREISLYFKSEEIFSWSDGNSAWI